MGTESFHANLVRMLIIFQILFRSRMNEFLHLSDGSMVMNFSRVSSTSSIGL